MARRKKDEGWFDVLLSLFTEYPAWLCIPVAFGVFIAINVILKKFSQLGLVFGGFAALAVLLAGATAGLRKVRRRIIYDGQTSIDSIRELSWSQFELLIGEAFRRQGYQVTETGGEGADGGIDLKLEGGAGTALVQCKQWKVYKVGVKPLRELYGVLMAERAQRAIFVTSGVYTREAMEFAKGKPMQLIDGAALCQLITSIRQQQIIAKPAPGSIDESTANQDLPACPICNGRMALRTAKRGDNAGSRFWGCATFPKCRGTRSVVRLAA